MGDYTTDIRTAFLSGNGMARFNRVLWDEEIKVMYFDHFGVYITEVWMNGDVNNENDFGIHSNNSLNNDNAVTLWENT